MHTVVLPWKQEVGGRKSAAGAHRVLTVEFLQQGAVGGLGEVALLVDQSQEAQFLWKQSLHHQHHHHQHHHHHRHLPRQHFGGFPERLP